MAERRGWRGLSRLKRAINKIKLLLSLDPFKWQLSSMLRSPTRRPVVRSLTLSPSPKHVGYGGQPGLLVCTAAEGAEDRSVRRLERVKSYNRDEEDIDKRSEIFIANFYKQLKLEKQISLDLSYKRSSSSTFNNRFPFSPSSSSSSSS